MLDFFHNLGLFLNYIRQFYIAEILLVALAFIAISLIIKKRFTQERDNERTLPYIILNGFITINLVILSMNTSIYIVSNLSDDMKTGTEWYANLLYGDTFAYSFNIIPLGIWAIVGLIKLVVLSIILSFIMLKGYRLLLKRLKS